MSDIPFKPGIKTTAFFSKLRGDGQIVVFQDGFDNMLKDHLSDLTDQDEIDAVRAEATEHFLAHILAVWKEILAVEYKSRMSGYHTGFQVGAVCMFLACVVVYLILRYAL